MSSQTALFGLSDTLVEAERLLLYVLLICRPKNKTALLAQLRALGLRASATRAFDSTM